MAFCCSALQMKLDPVQRAAVSALHTQKSKRWKSSVLFLSQRVQKSQSFWNHFNIDRWNVSVSRELKEDNTHPAQLYGGKQAPEGFVTLGNNALHNHSGCIIIKAGCYLQGLCQPVKHRSTPIQSASCTNLLVQLNTRSHIGSTYRLVQIIRAERFPLWRPSLGSWQDAAVLYMHTHVSRARTARRTRACSRQRAQMVAVT